MADLLCVSGKADGKWVDVDLQQRRVGDHWKVPVPLKSVRLLPYNEELPINDRLKIELYRIECLHLCDPRGNLYPDRKIHFLVKHDVDLFDAMVLLFRNYAPESRDDAKPD